ncbi:nesprin-2-like [Acipenser oxyrinchus oxyrinchus]|uniref:Nesprin-2-like n=1 Tax=Acipenser oxyrinchus oxyrinchus TaxID=40147 RepID=A0AAD8D3S0_ACIOX|nr:nesprin-2-like [Acipenser oxyrinchus oxyrinchus]
MKEVDAKSSVKSSLISTGNQLLQVKQADTASLQNQLAQFEQGWTEVLTPLPGIQEKLHQLQMEKVPSRQAITELKTWMSEIHGLLREDEEKISRLSTTASAKEILQKYKDYKTEMNCKQLTVDFVNQSVLQISSLDIQSKRYDMAEFAECLGALNLQWQLLQGALSNKMRAVEHMLAVFIEKERKMQLISCWCKAQEERILGFQTPASLTSAENALKDCQEIEEKLKIKSTEIQELKHCYLSPAKDSSEHLHIDFITQVDEVNADWTSLKNQVIQTKASLQSTVQQWKAFDETFQEVDLNIMKARYTLELSHFPVLSIEALKSQVENLKSLLEDAEKNEERWNALSSVFTTLKTMCSPTAVKLITENLEDARTRWTAVNQDSSDELRKAQSLYQLWQKYRNLFTDSTLLLKTHEEECSKLLSAVPSEESTVDFMQRKIDTINKLVNETENMQSIAAQVSETSKELIQQVDPSAAILIASEVTNLSNRLAQLGKLLAIKLSEHQDELKQLEEFNRCLASLEHHLKDSEGIVANTKDPNINDPSSMDQSRTRMLKLNAMTPDLEYLNDLSYKIPLNDVNIKRVQTLNRQWAQASSRALERCSELQGVLLDKQNFVQKCENWMRFLEKMEDSLAVDIAGCYVGLKEQQRIHELFQAEVSIGHQILHSVINEAQHLLERGEVEDRSEFILKLSLLKEQWQGAIRRAQQRKGVIEGLVRQWHHYQDSLKKLKTFLSDTANHLDLSSRQAHHGLHQTRREVEDIKHKEMLFQRHRCSYILTLETGKQIFSMANPETETLLQEELCELQESWEHTETLLKEKKQLMNTALESWENCENKINEFGRLNF